MTAYLGRPEGWETFDNPIYIPMSMTAEFTKRYYWHAMQNCPLHAETKSIPNHVSSTQHWTKPEQSLTSPSNLKEDHMEKNVL